MVGSGTSQGWWWWEWWALSYRGCGLYQRALPPASAGLRISQPCLSPPSQALLKLAGKSWPFLLRSHQPRDGIESTSVCVYYICVLDYAKKDNPCSVGLDAGICLLGYKILLVISSAGNLRPQYSQTHLPGSGISWHICISQPWQRWC